MYSEHVDPSGRLASWRVSTEFEHAVEAMRAAGIEVQIERNGVDHLLLTVRGEAVDDWRDGDGPWLTVVAHEGGPVPAA